jgi:hypothetical protein
MLLRIRGNHCDGGTFSLPSQDAEKLRPPYVVRGLGKPCSGNALHVQVFVDDKPVLLNQRKRDLNDASLCAGFRCARELVLNAERPCGGSLRACACGKKWDVIAVAALMGTSAAYEVFALARTGL